MSVTIFVPINLYKLSLTLVQDHYYQPLWTLVGAGMKKLDQTVRPMRDVLPKQCDHHKEQVHEFDPENNTITLGNGQKVICGTVKTLIKYVHFYQIPHVQNGMYVSLVHQCRVSDYDILILFVLYFISHVDWTIYTCT